MDIDKIDLLTLKQKIKQTENFDKASKEYKQYKQTVEQLYYYIQDLLINAETIVENFRNKNRIIIGIELRLNLLYINKTNCEIDFKSVTKKYIRDDKKTLEILQYIEKNMDNKIIEKNLKKIYRKQIYVIVFN